MGQCNFCTYQASKRRAKIQGMKIIKKSANWGMGGIHIYICPKNMKSKDIIEDSPEHEKYFDSWLVELTNHCCC